MEHFLDYMDKTKKNMENQISNQHPDWNIDSRFTIYTYIEPIVDDILFKTKFRLRKRKKTSVIFEQEFNNRKARYYFDEYNIIRTLIYIYDNFQEEGNHICERMSQIIDDGGEDVEFKLDNKIYKFKGIGYMSENKEFLTDADYLIGINDFICLLNLVIEKDRYGKNNYNNENGKKTIIKYLLFLFLVSERTKNKSKTKLINILKQKSIYTGLKLESYKKVINTIGRNKLHLEIGLSKDILWYNKKEES